MLIPPLRHAADVAVQKGPNIKEVPVKEPLAEKIKAVVLLKLGDNITTDDIMPAGSTILPLRSNIPAISEYAFANIDHTFSRRAKEVRPAGGGIIVGGENYGQGSSREHAAIAPMFLGVQAVIANSFARIHRANLINFGILPLLLRNAGDYGRVEQGDILMIQDVKSALAGDQSYSVFNETKKYSFEVFSQLNDREKEIILSGGLLPNTKKHIDQSGNM
jgi:aconitate hydratase